MTNGNFYLTLRDGFTHALENPCLTSPCGASFTYREMEQGAAAIAGAYYAAGAKPGDRIVVQVEKSAQNVMAYLGALRTGLVYVPLNTAYTSDELSYFLDDAQPAIFICDPERADELAPIAHRAGVATLMTLDRNGAGELMDVAKDAAPFSDCQTRHGDDLAAILYTSGTTGRSKGAMLSHDKLRANALALNALWGFSKSDVLLHALPIFHIHGLFVALHTAMLSGCEIVFLPKFDIEEVLKQLPRASVMMGVPTFYTRLLAEPSFTGAICAHMRLFISGSAPLSADAFDAFKERTGHAILERYGMSEAGMIASNPLDGARVAGTVGFALPGVSIRIVNEDGEAVAPNETGGVEVKGPNIFKGYWKKPEKTADEFTADGFFKTGDIGALDEEGRLVLMGRSKDLIIAGGYNIYPKEIEDVLSTLAGVAEAAVIGAPHPDMGEGVIAAIVDGEEPASDEQIAKVLESLARFKRPRKIFRIETLPRNAMGKVQKQLLRKRYQDAFKE